MSSIDPLVNRVLIPIARQILMVLLTLGSVSINWGLIILLKLWGRTLGTRGRETYGPPVQWSRSMLELDLDDTAECHEDQCGATC